ncbi:MAG: CAP domain-containing protein [Clostridium sp.]|nr:CAP domain-containing protein [Clostridium sp.]
MRKISICTLSATAVMLASTAMPVTSLAALSTYQIPYSNGSAYIIGIGGQNCLPGAGNQNGSWGQAGNWSQNGSWGQNNGWGAGPVFPDNTLPEAAPPDFIFPTPELPGPELPEQPGDMLPELPDGVLPDDPGAVPDVPGDMLPDNPGVSPEIPGEQTPGKPDHGESQDEYGEAVAELVNAERAKAGLSPLTVDAGVGEAAQVRAEEIRKAFSHTRPDGSSFSTILAQMGITYRGVGENIAYGQNSPESVMESWMNSSGHRANILNKDYTTIGVGHYQDANGTDYWTQIFTY